MLNLRPIFVDAIHALSKYESYLAIPSLPATVFLMQSDVINHYRYALTHYLPLSLDKPFLQNSSIGSPYEKWAKFTNDDFDMFSFAVTNLIRYTSRLIHESESAGLEATEHYAESKARSSIYISPLVEINTFGKQVGIHVREDNCLVVTPFDTEPGHEGTLRMTSVADGPTQRYHVTIDDDGNEDQRPITLDEYRQLAQTLRPTEFDLCDRSILDKLVADGLAEIEAIAPLNENFGRLCNLYCAQRDVASPFDNLNQSWWV